MSFLTAASDRSSSGSGVSGVSGVSFSGVSGLTSSFSFTTALVLLLAINFSSRPHRGTPRILCPPTLWGKSPRPAPKERTYLDPALVSTRHPPVPTPAAGTQAHVITTQIGQRPLAFHVRPPPRPVFSCAS